LPVSLNCQVFAVPTSPELDCACNTT
jgi:hypothetical protein